MPEVTGLTGFANATIDGVVYVVDAIDIPSQTSRVIERSNGDGDAADYELRKASEHITGTMTLQRAAEDTVFPEVNDKFGYDFDDVGTASTLVVTEVKANRSKDEMLTFEIGVLVDAYKTAPASAKKAASS